MDRYLIIFICAVILTACSKQDEWLDKKSNKGDLIPTKLEDFQELLNNDGIMNDVYPLFGSIGADNYYIKYENWQSLSAPERNAYVWNKEIYMGETVMDWNSPYTIVAYTNIVLEGLGKLTQTPENIDDYNSVKGSALFFRSLAFYNLAQLFAKQYDQSSAPTDLGIPLRLSSDVNEKSVRASVEQTYVQIVNDLIQADSLLPNTSDYKTRPSKVAAKALLARVYLHLADYSKANFYATSAVELHKGRLLDFNTLDTTRYSPFPSFSENTEIILYAGARSTSIMSAPAMIVDSTLLKLYEPGDLRRKAFYRNAEDGSTNFRGFYTGRNQYFAGIGLNELYLIKAETNARLNRVQQAMEDLNELLIKRWQAGKFKPKVATGQSEALRIALEQRRIELPFTGSLRWEDLRRLNKEPEFAKTLKRTAGGTTYTLPPNDSRYIYPIPDDEIRLSGIQQNER